MYEGLAVEPSALIADPSLHEADDAEGLVHRFPAESSSEGGWFGGPLNCRLSIEEELRRGVLVFERTGSGGKYWWRGAFRELLSVICRLRGEPLLKLDEDML